MACFLDDNDVEKTSQRIRLGIAQDYINRKKTWDIPGDARAVIQDLIKLIKELDPSLDQISERR